MQTHLRTFWHCTVVSLAALLCTPHLAAQALPASVEGKGYKTLIKYEHLKNRVASNGKAYDIKIQYGRTWSPSSEGRRTGHAFTRVLLSRHGKNNYRKPSADRLSELFPGSMVYASMQIGVPKVGSCGKKKWYRSSERTTFVRMTKRYCNKHGFKSGHRARIGREMLVDGKV